MLRGRQARVDTADSFAVDLLQPDGQFLLLHVVSAGLRVSSCPDVVFKSASEPDSPPSHALIGEEEPEEEDDDARRLFRRPSVVYPSLEDGFGARRRARLISPRR